ncbi:hypothetical protein TIFTF001_001496 [Ficus carica]|uniref:Target of Myb protein 1 n=1 Tax=Ficus carica TaxID=3494 RepID=A0AA88CRB8_FICCA|nr:hypothetical protein TIFTF001_001496 [Ficus carica]
MPASGLKMAAELVNSATSEKLPEMDWTKNIEICELVARDQRQAKDVIKAIKKRLGSKHANTQLYAVLLLEMLMNNIGENIHKQVVDIGILPILVKMVKKKSAGVQFPQRPPAVSSDHPSPQPNNNNLPNGELAPSRHEGFPRQTEPQDVPESSIIQKATNVLEVLKEVLDAVDSQHPEGAKDEFTLDLVEQCSFQKQRVMHLVMTSRDEKVVSQAIELNEQLQKVLAKHDALLSAKPRSTTNHFNQEEAEEEEEAEQLFRRLRKGKACARPEDEERPAERPHLGFLGSAIPGEMLNRPLIRPLSLEPSSHEPNGHAEAVAIPPPPAKHMEREKYFQENKADGLAGHVRGLSLHSRNASSSRSESIDSSD